MKGKCQLEIPGVWELPMLMVPDFLRALGQPKPPPVLAAELLTPLVPLAKKRETNMKAE